MEASRKKARKEKRKETDRKKRNEKRGQERSEEKRSWPSNLCSSLAVQGKSIGTEDREAKSALEVCAKFPKEDRF